MDDWFPFPLKELLGQKPVGPAYFLEALVTFYNNSLVPLEFPALKGEPYDDTGDFQIPFISTTNTEIQRFKDLSLSLPGIYETISPDNSISNIEPTVEEADDGEPATDNYFYVRELKITTALPHCLNVGDSVRIEGNNSVSDFPGGGSITDEVDDAGDPIFTAPIDGILNGVYEVQQVDDELVFWIR